MPAEFGNIEAQLMLWLFAMIRPGAAFLAAPVFSAPAVPVQLRLIIALGIGVPAASAAGVALPPDGMASFAGLLAIGGEIVAGLALGFAVQIGLAAAFLAGEVISNTMGLGFAAMSDPVGGQVSPAIGQFLSMLGTFLFLAVGGHLALAQIIVESYQALPPGSGWLSHDAIGGLVRFGGLVFAAGLSIALPVAFAMVLVQIVMAMIARSTPTLNLFAVGLPATLLAGIILLAIAAPAMGDSLMNALEAGLGQARLLANG
ncbi:MAG: flagellar biosynthetic protein FliR [Pseudomonadota bacterium]